MSLYVIISCTSTCAGFGDYILTHFTQGVWEAEVTVQSTAGNSPQTAKKSQHSQKLI